MGILTKKQIVERLERGELLTSPRKIGNDYDVESSSYDLAVGTIVIKRNSKKLFQKRTEHLEFNPEIKQSKLDKLLKKNTVTLDRLITQLN